MEELKKIIEDKIIVCEELINESISSIQISIYEAKITAYKSILKEIDKLSN